MHHYVKFITWKFQVFFLSCFVSYRLHSQKLPISVIGIQSRTLENQSLFHVSEISEGKIIPVQKTPLETKSLDPKSRTIRSLGASRFLRPCKNHINYFGKKVINGKYLVQPNRDGAHHFGGFWRLTICCLERYPSSMYRCISKPVFSPVNLVYLILEV